MSKMHKFYKHFNFVGTFIFYAKEVSIVHHFYILYMNILCYMNNLILVLLISFLQFLVQKTHGPKYCSFCSRPFI